MRLAPKTRKRLAATLTGLVATVLVASSCSFDAEVETDRRGHVVGVQTLELRSGALDLALALAREGTELVLQLRWRADPAESGVAF